MSPTAKQKADETFKYQTSADPAELARYLAVLAEGAAVGALAVAEGERCFTIRPRGLTDLMVKVRRKNGRTKVSLDMSWAEDEVADPPPLAAARP